MAIIVGKKWDPGAIYVGRGSPLGNPFKMYKEADRNMVCDSYHNWFYAMVENNDPKIMKELDRLKRLASQGDLVLGCYCAPRRCHAETIKEYLDKELGA